MALTYSRKKLINLAKGEQRARLIQGMDRPSFESNNDILDFEHYFSKHTLISGIHGPQEHNGKVYISIYHFMEYNGIVPTLYDTIAIGGCLSDLTTDYKVCRYKEHSFNINKCEYHFIKEHKHIFKQYLK
jgi:hypothetical protein